MKLKRKVKRLWNRVARSTYVERWRPYALRDGWTHALGQCPTGLINHDLHRIGWRRFHLRLSIWRADSQPSTYRTKGSIAFVVGTLRITISTEEKEDT